MVTDDTDRGIRMFAWAHDGRHLLYLQDTGGDENWRLHDVDLETMQRRDLTPFDDVQTQLIATEKKFPTEILVGLNRDNPQLHDVYRLDLVSGELVKEVENPGFIGWLADAQLVVRAGLAPQPDGGLVVMVRDQRGRGMAAAAVHRRRGRADQRAGRVQRGRRLAAGGQLGRRGHGQAGPLRPGHRGVEVLAEDPEADVTGVRLHPDTREPQIVMFLKDRTEYLVLDPAVAPDLAAIRALHPGDPSFSGRRRRRQDMAGRVHQRHRRGPVLQLRPGDARPAGSCSSTSRSCPATSSRRWSRSRSPRRDGLTIHGYATFPPGAGRQGLPTVLNVHGGPWARDAWGYDPEAQWLANRGYLCVQVNFRGSTGYGKAFVNAGDREWGGRMHDDLVDAVAYATGQGWADPARVAIYGGSYGGYAALAGRDVHPGRVPLRGGHRRAVEPEDPHRDDPAVLGAR